MSRPCFRAVKHTGSAMRMIELPCSGLAQGSTGPLAGYAGRPVRCTFARPVPRLPERVCRGRAALSFMSRAVGAEA